MECPFCFETINDEARVCKSCGRDLRLVRPVIEENAVLIAKIEELQSQVYSANAALARRTAPLTFWSTHSAIYVVGPVVLLIAAHFVVTVVLDISPLYLRLASVVIPLPFGFAMIWFSHHGMRWSIFDGVLIGLISVAGMLTVVGFIDNVPILPDNPIDWRETLEYALSIALANVTGATIALLLRRLLPQQLDARQAPGPLAIKIAQMISHHVGERALRRRAQKIQNNFRLVGTAAGALIAGAGSIYTGIRAVIGGF
jgi:hypothetical protein